MKKQFKQLMVLLLVLVLVVAGYFGVQKYNEVQAEKAQEETRTVLFDVNKDDVISLSYDYKDVVYSFEKKDGAWFYTEDPSIELNESLIYAMLNQVTPLLVEQEITGVTDMSQYGLDNPSRRVEFSTATGTYVFEAGNMNKLTSLYYIRVPGESTVYAVKALVVNIFTKSIDDVKIVEYAPSTTESTTAAQ